MTKCLTIPIVVPDLREDGNVLINDGGGSPLFHLFTLARGAHRISSQVLPTPPIASDYIASQYLEHNENKEVSLSSYQATSQSTAMDCSSSKTAVDSHPTSTSGPPCDIA